MLLPGVSTARQGEDLVKFHQLINQVEWPDIEAAILLHYPDQVKALEGYRVILDQMLITEPVDQPGHLEVEPYQFDAGEKPEGADAPADVTYYEPGDEMRQSVGFTVPITRTNIRKVDTRHRRVRGGIDPKCLEQH